MVKKIPNFIPPPMFGNNFFDIFNRMLGKNKILGDF